MTLTLPSLILLEDHSGNWDSYLAALYEVFKQDFIDSKPVFEGRPLNLKRHPILQGKEATFWHFITEGEVEAERTPNLRRCERLPWVKPIIEGNPHEDIKFWIEKRGQENRIHLCYGDWEYLVVLADRGTYLLPWTAFYVEEGHRKRNLEKRYNAYKAEIAP